MLALLLALPISAHAGSSAEYTVYPAPVESPNHTTPLPPDDARMTLVAPADPLASPFGWHDTDGVAGAEHTTLEGNNAVVFSQDSNPPLPVPDCGADLECNFPLDLTQPPETYTAASQANAFYWYNLFHDVTYRHGFTSPAGNFQVNDYGEGGVGGDPLSVRFRYDASCASAVGIPPDGAAGSLILSPCTVGGITRDTAHDSVAMLHLAGHALVHRLLGGPSNPNCYTNLQNPVEGWADYLGLLFTIELGDAGTDPRPYATYFLGQPTDGPGARGAPYSTDPALNGWTYETIINRDRFGVGAVWAQALWHATWALIDLHGFDPNLEDPTGGAGNQRMLSYMIAGLQLAPCNPSFLDARDAFLAAAELADPADVCPLWEAFATVGMGTDAVSTSPNSTQVTNGFAVPATCREPFFTNGFETGDCSGWSAVFPGC